MLEGVQLKKQLVVKSCFCCLPYSGLPFCRNLFHAICGLSGGGGSVRSLRIMPCLSKSYGGSIIHLGMNVLFFPFDYQMFGCDDAI